MKGFSTLRYSPRFWMLFASLSTRGAGFLTSLLIARLVGSSALGVYSSLVNTVASVTTPFTQVLTNNATLLGAEGARNGKDNYRIFARSSFSFALLLSVISGGILVVLYSFMLDDGGLNSIFLLLVSVGIAIVTGQVLGAVSLGFLYGAGEFTLASRISFVVALVVCLGAYPAIQHYGLNGALVLLVFATVLPLIAMGARVLLSSRGIAVGGGAHLTAGHEVRARFFRALPSVAAIMVNNGVNWVCTIFLVQSIFGTVSVGVVAVAAQWLNLMLIPATSWGGVSLKVLTDAIANGNEKTVWHASVGLMRKNFLVTIALAGSIALASGLIARAYGLSDTDVAMLICINALCATVAAINNIFERFLLALDRQDWWLFFSLASFSAQLAVTLLFITKGLWMVPVGVLAASITLCLLSYFGVSRALPLQMKEQK